MAPMKIEAVFDFVNDDLQKLENELSENVKSAVPLIPEIGKYIFHSGGKRFRPLVLFLAAKLCGYTGTHHILCASIFEFIHTATLLHDDVIDNAEVRRGTVSVNSKWGNETSVLMGDYLLSKSFSLLMNVGSLKIMGVLADATIQLAEGEFLELTKSWDPLTTEEEYLSVVMKKTAVLFSAACRVGAMLGNAPQEKERALEGFGLNLGIAFQLIDDMLDYISTDEEFGKTIGKDLYEGKATLPLIYTLRVCVPPDREKIIKSMEANKPEEQVIRLVKDYKGPEHTFKRAREYIEIAKGFIKDIDPSMEKEALLTTADYVVERKW